MFQPCVELVAVDGLGLNWSKFKALCCRHDFSIVWMQICDLCATFLESDLLLLRMEVDVTHDEGHKGMS